MTLRVLVRPEDGEVSGLRSTDRDEPLEVVFALPGSDSADIEHTAAHLIAQAKEHGCLSIALKTDDRAITENDARATDSLTLALALLAIDEYICVLTFIDGMTTREGMRLDAVEPAYWRVYPDGELDYAIAKAC